MEMRLGLGTAFGTFGELLQGVLPEADGGQDGDFLVTLPIARWTMAAFRTETDGGALTVAPARKRKSLRLARMIAADAGYDGGGRLTVNSVIPQGKGLASSSADLVATARAVGAGLGVRLSARRIERYLARIEPSDGVLYPGVVAYHHRSVRLRAVLGSLPAMTVVGIDEGGTVDTIAFNRRPKPFTSRDRETYARLLDRLTVAVRRGDLAEVGAVASQSALMNQVLRPKPSLAPLLAVCREVGGLGVAVGHSGTTLGLLLDAADPDHAARTHAAAQACAELAGKVSVYRTLSFAGVAADRGPGSARLVDTLRADPLDAVHAPAAEVGQRFVEGDAVLRE
ncbi:kinase [Streptomyces boninensis]|uniref:GHMP family kinase ATP-binding protein n=1 Tax=Streptomyces boninensis TaxID=2039455 RepID=UPI003B21A59E